MDEIRAAGEPRTPAARRPAPVPHRKRPGHVTLAATVLALVVALLGGCGRNARDAAPWAGTVDTLGSGRVVVHDPVEGRWSADEAWSFEEDLRIGSLDADGPEQLAYVADVWPDPFGRLWVADGPAHEILVFDPQGRFVRAIGRAGQGPGEIGTITRIELGPDGNAWVADGQNRRFTVLDTAGTLVRTLPYPVGLYGYGDRWGPDGLLYTWVALRGSAFTQRIVRRRLQGDTLAVLDTLPVPPVDPGAIVPVSMVREGRTVTAMLPLPFQATPVRLLTPGSGWWLSHPGERLRVARLGPGGDTLLVFERPYEPVPVRRADVDAAIASFGVPGLEMPRNDIPAVHPPVRELVALPDGHLLLRRVGPRGDVVEVYDPDGIFLGDALLPGGMSLTIHHATDRRLYGVVKGELDVPYVVRIAIRR